MKRRTKERGITLVSLAVTIIVLLILAGVTVRLAIGDNGVITEAELAANGWDKAITEYQLMEQQVETQVKIQVVTLMKQVEVMEEEKIILQEEQTQDKYMMRTQN